MANKQKAWRIKAAKINALRANGSREATARVQKDSFTKMLPIPSFLFMGMMMRAGFWDPMPITRSALPTPAEFRQGGKSWLSRAWAKAKGLFA
jgi:hypothetical protein